MNDAVKWDIGRAVSIAGHEAIGEERRHNGKPYWTHTQEVAEILRKLGFPIDVQVAAWCHDLVEDTLIKEAILLTLIGKQATKYVMAMTDLPLPRAFNRAKKKAIMRLHFRRQIDVVQSIKCADLISNAKSIFTEDKTAFRYTFWVEASLLLNELRHAHPELKKRLAALLDNFQPPAHVIEKEMKTARRAEDEISAWYETNHALFTPK